MKPGTLRFNLIVTVLLPSIPAWQMTQQKGTWSNGIIYFTQRKIFVIIIKWNIIYLSQSWAKKLVHVSFNEFLQRRLKDGHRIPSNSLGHLIEDDGAVEGSIYIWSIICPPFISCISIRILIQRAHPSECSFNKGRNPERQWKGKPTKQSIHFSWIYQLGTNKKY